LTQQAKCLRAAEFREKLKNERTAGCLPGGSPSPVVKAGAHISEATEMSDQTTPQNPAETSGDFVERGVEAARAVGDAWFVSDAFLALIAADPGLPTSAANAAKSLKGSANHAGLMILKRAFERDHLALDAALRALRSKLEAVADTEGLDAARAARTLQFLDHASDKLAQAERS
jgi:hypothetical protein